MGEKVYVNARVENGVVIADVITHSLSDYESKLVQHDIIEVARAGTWTILLDCTRVTFLASAGIGMMIALRKQCLEAGGKFVVCGLSDDITEAMRLTRVDKLLHIEPDRNAALASLR